MFSHGLVVANGFGASTASERKADVKALVALLPRKPLPSPAIEPYISDFAAAEKYICTELGHAQKFPDQMMKLIKEGVSIRLLDSNNKPGKVIGLFPTSGPEALTLTDIDYLEVLLHKRIRAMWRAEPSSRRGREPRLCQVGRVLRSERLQGRISAYRDQVAMGNRLAIQNGLTPGHDVAVCKVWVALDEELIGFTSASQDETQRNNLLGSWNVRAPAARQDIETKVDVLVRAHLVG